MSVYKFLDPDDIRLLTVSIHNGTIVSLELYTYSRAAAPEYDAVSYTWGDDTSTVSMECNGMSLEIRTHLHRALPFLHDFTPEPKTRPLWIDAICLNQDDREEKAAHVPRMGEVYESAARTLIWLGEAADNSDLAMEKIESLTQKMLTVQNPSSLTFLQTIARYDLPLPEDEVWEAIKTLQLRPWVFRLWTLQEVVLSKEAVLLCGRKSIPWESLVALHEAAIQAHLSILVDSKEDPEYPYKRTQMIISHVNFLQKTDRE